jgi:hypothetical protein
MNHEHALAHRTPITQHIIKIYNQKTILNFLYVYYGAKSDGEAFLGDAP